MERILDTNVILNYPNCIEKFLNDEECDAVIISIRVLEELDNLKNNRDGEVAYKARRASHIIKERILDLDFEESHYPQCSVDDELIAVAEDYGYTLITNDVNMQIKAAFQNVNFEEYQKKEENYTGIVYKEIELDELQQNEWLTEILETKQPDFPMAENQFLIIQDKNSKRLDRYGKERLDTVCIFIYQAGELRILNKTHHIDNAYVGKITPRNAEQECLFELLNNKDVKILCASGGYGTGKSYLLINYALQELEKGQIKKIIYVPNNSFGENTREIGALPGELVEKEILFMGTIVDMLGGEYAVSQLITNEQLEVAPISTMRGRNFTDSIVIVNEAQNLTEDHIKLLIARCGEGTRIFFDGDIKQVDSAVFRNKNGLKILPRLKDSSLFSKIFGMVRLINIERSLTALAAAYLDEQF